MPNLPAISVENLSKTYTIGRKVQYNTLRDQIALFANNLLREKRVANKHEKFFALNNISLTVNPGEVVGIIGKNGAGKSTLLKIISQITEPSSGKIILNGKVSSLLEVGTGFSPELTGRENVYLNGSILGMNRSEIKRKFDEIVDFSEVEQFIDTPVKHYSSGMYVRLAFAVAAHLEPDILIVDEVLAVGDVEFQKKCLNKMSSITRQLGRTILFVSHSMPAVLRLCHRAVLLEKGQVKQIGKTQIVVDEYLKNPESSQSEYSFVKDPHSNVNISRISVLNETNKPIAKVNFGKIFKIRVEFLIQKFIKKSTLSITVKYKDEILFISSECDQATMLKSYPPGKYVTNILFPAFLLNVGEYTFDISMSNPGIETICEKRDVPLEVVVHHSNKNAILGDTIQGIISPNLEFDSQKSL